MSNNKQNNEAFPKSHRLLNRRDFLCVYDDGEFTHDGYLWVYVLRRSDDHGARVGITVPRKVGKAVVRNKLRRRLRESLRRVYASIHSDCDIVVNCSPRSANLPFEDLNQRLLKLLGKAGVYHEDADS